MGAQSMPGVWRSVTTKLTRCVFAPPCLAKLASAFVITSIWHFYKTIPAYESVQIHQGHVDGGADDPCASSLLALVVSCARGRATWQVRYPL